MQHDELTHQIRRLSHHPSIVVCLFSNEYIHFISHILSLYFPKLWDSCNECDGGGLYDSFVMTTVAREDNSRSVWPACPSNGWSSGVDTLFGIPNGDPLVSKSIDWYVIIIFYIYYYL